MITSLANPKVRLVRRLASRAQRGRLGLFVAEGEDVVSAALDAGVQPIEVLVDAERPALADRLPEAVDVAGKVLQEISNLAHPARVIAVFRRADLPRSAPAGSDRGLALWRVSDPANMGSLIRSVDALGGAFMCLSRGCADPTGPKAVRASAGALFRVPLLRFDGAPRPRVGLVPRGGQPLAALETSPRTFVLGAEREGLPDEIVGECDGLATIALAGGAESLNVAVAGALALYEARRAPCGGGAD